MPEAPIPVLLTNRRAIFRCSPEIQIRLKKIFSYRHPRCQFIASFRDGSWDGHVTYFQRSCVATGLFLEARDSLEQEFNLQVTDERVFPEFREFSDPKSRPYQNESVEAMIKASSTGGLILSATGSGKTRTAAVFFKRLKGTGAFVVDELTLLEQTRRALIEVLGEKVGVVGRSEFNPHRITVATIQTLHKHRHKPAFKKWFPNIDVLIVDEVHLALNKRNLDVIQQIRPKATFGLTATLQIEKPEVRIPAIALTGPVIFEYPLQDGVEEGYLSRGVVGSISFYDPLRGQAPGYRSYSGKEHVWVPSGSKPAEYRYHVCLNKARNDCIESLVRQALKIKRRVIVLVEQKIHLRILSQRMKDVHHEALCGDVDTDTRFHAMREMDLGKLNLILASRVFAKGVDVRSVDLIIDATGLPSRNNAIQRYGRGARKAEGKKGLIFLSIADRGNRFEMAGRLREGALRETGTPILQFDWKKNPEEILSRCRVGEVLSSGDRNDPYRVTSDCMPVGHLRYSSSPSITSR